jgi:hypothetical protein
MTVPAPKFPLNGAAVVNASQPISLFVAKVVTTGVDAPAYRFEVALDAGFANKVATKDAKPSPSANIPLASVLLDPLPAGTKYYLPCQSTAQQ